MKLGSFVGMPVIDIRIEGHDPIPSNDRKTIRLQCVRYSFPEIRFTVGKGQDVNERAESI